MKPAEKRIGSKVLPAVLCVVILVRILISMLPSYRIDMGGYKAWSIFLAENGFESFYKTFHVVYAPAYMYLLWVTGKLAQIFSLSGVSHEFFVKIWAVLSDIAGGYLIYRIAVQRRKEHTGLILGTIYCLNPGVFFNSSIWGQFDSIPATLLLGVIYLMTQSRKVSAFILFCAAVLVKPQSGLLAPVVLYMFFRDFSFKKAADRLRLAYSFIGGLCAYIVAVVPFYSPTPLHEKAGATVDVFYWMFHLYRLSLDDYPFATANAFNAWTLLGGQLVQDSTRFIGITYSAWGLLLVGLTIAAALLFLHRSGTSGMAPYYASFLVLAGSFIFATRMHERYLLPAVIFITVCILFDRRLWIAAFAASACVLTNHWYIYDNAFKEIIWLKNYDTIAVMCASATLALFLWSMYYAFRFSKDSFLKAPEITKAGVKP